MAELNFAALAAEVSRIETVGDSAIALLQGVVAELGALKLANADDQAQLDAFVAALKAQTDELAAAVVAGTPTP